MSHYKIHQMACLPASCLALLIAFLFRKNTRLDKVRSLPWYMDYEVRKLEQDNSQKNN